MNSSELFQFLSEKLPTVEFLFFKWSGGGDDWTGYEFIKGKNETGEITEFPLSGDTDIQNEMKSFVLFEELALDINCTDQGWSEGILLIALKPLADSFEDDSITYLYQDSGFKGFALAGKNHNEISGSLEV
jgi:hypothetical protein